MNSVDLKQTSAQVDLLKIGDIAKLTGLTLRTLRYYEEMQLIVPDTRTKGNFRLYSNKVLNKLNFINSLKKLDFTLEEIKELLGPVPEETLDDDQIIQRTITALKQKQLKIGERLNDLKNMDVEVKNSLQMLEECLVCRQSKSFDVCNPHCDHKAFHIE